MRRNGFPPSIKKLILSNLQALAKRHPWFLYGIRDTELFGLLSCQELLQDFRKILGNPDEPQSVTVCILHAIQNGGILPELAEDLIRVARDSRYAISIRREAVTAFIHVASERIDELVKLLDEINSGSVPDNDFCLRGDLLQVLYPEKISPKKVLDYIIEDNSRVIGGYSYFVSHDLVEKTNDIDIPDLIDAASMADKHTRHDHSWQRFVGRLVRKGLEICGDTIASDKLFKWLKITVGEHYVSIIGEDEKRFIRGWMESHPVRMREFYEYCIDAAPDDKLHEMEYRLQSMICGNIKLTGQKKWLLGKALAETNNVKAELYFNKAIRLINEETDVARPTLEELYEFVDRYPQFKETLKSWRTCDLDNLYLKDAKLENKWKSEEEKRKKKNIQIFTSRLELIRTGQDIGNLHALACSYYALWVNTNKDLSPIERLVDNTKKKQEGLRLNSIQIQILLQVPTAQPAPIIKYPAHRT